MGCCCSHMSTRDVAVANLKVSFIFTSNSSSQGCAELQFYTSGVMKYDKCTCFFGVCRNTVLYSEISTTEFCESYVSHTGDHPKQYYNLCKMSFANGDTMWFGPASRQSVEHIKRIIQVDHDPL
eukprot:191547_1